MKHDERRQALLQRLHHARHSGASGTAGTTAITIDAAPGHLVHDADEEQQGLPGEERQGRHHRGARGLQHRATSGVSSPRRCTRSSTTASSTTRPTSTSCTACSKRSASTTSSSTTKTTHTMVLIDAMPQHKRKPDQATRSSWGNAMNYSEPTIMTGTCSRRCATAKTVLHRLRLPRAGDQDRGRRARPRSRREMLGKMEWFESSGEGRPERRQGRSPGAPTTDAVKQRAKVRIEELHRAYGVGHRHDQRARRLGSA